MRTLVLVVVHTVVVGIAPQVSTKAPSEECGTRNKRGRSVAISNFSTFAARVTDDTIFATIHFIFMVEAKVLEGTYGHFKTDSKVDIVREVETETRGNEHGVFAGFKLVNALGLQASFARVFQEHIYPVLRNPVHASTIHKHIGQILVQRVHIASRQVNAERLTPLGKIPRGGKACSKSPVIRSKGVCITFTIQVPHVAGAHTGSLFTCGYIHIKHQGHTEHIVGIQRESDLGPQVQVTAASSPLVCYTSNTAIGISMFVVNRQNGTHVQPVQQTYPHKEVTGLAVIPVVVAVMPTIRLIHAATGKSPRRQRDVTTRTNGKVPLAKRLGINLMETVRAALHAYLGKAKACSQ